MSKVCATAGPDWTFLSPLRVCKFQFTKKRQPNGPPFYFFLEQFVRPNSGTGIFKARFTSSKSQRTTSMSLAGGQRGIYNKYVSNTNNAEGGTMWDNKRSNCISTGRLHIDMIRPSQMGNLRVHQYSECCGPTNAFVVEKKQSCGDPAGRLLTLAHVLPEL